LQQLKDCRVLFSLATVARASSDGPDASSRVEAKLREMAILLDHHEQANRARERDADVGEGEAVRNPTTVKAKGRPRTKRIRSIAEQAGLGRSAGAALAAVLPSA
jgi:hypothetical protein